MQNWLKMESSKSSVVVLPTISPTALTAMRKSSATNSSDASARRASRAEQVAIAGAVQRVLMARVDHHLQHFGIDFARPDQFLDRIFKASIPCPVRQETSIDNCERFESFRQESSLLRQINFVADEDAFLAGELGSDILRPPASAVRKRRGRGGSIPPLPASRGCGGCLRLQFHPAPRASRRCQ